MASLTDFHIALSPQNLSPGSYTFVVTNNGKVTHALEINGPGVSGQKTGFLQPGQSANLSVNLQNGSYDVFCPVDGHKSLGMNLTMNVGSSTGGGGASGATTMPPSTAPPTTSSSGGGSSGGGYGY
jgi:hypothetical protein